jgi:hypothetical protein
VRRFVVPVMVAAVALGCAQPRQPEGGPPVVTPPRVVAVSPPAYSLLTDLRQPVVIHFDERLSERFEGVQDLRDAVLVSPRTGELQVRRGRRHLTISMEGGWQPDRVYRVEVLPVLRDLFNNVRREPVDLIFSTGAPIPETAVAGFAEDRLTGSPARGARVRALRDGDLDEYVTVADSAGFFALRELPPGEYDVTVWVDQNRNRVPDFAEPQDLERLSVAGGDTAIVEMRLLPGDTTPARLVRAAPLDSTRIELTFDDYFAPGAIDGTARLYRAADSSFVANGELHHLTRLDSLRAADRAAEEAAAAADTARDPVRDTLAAPPAPPPPTERRPARDAQPRGAGPRRELPARELILVMPGVLTPGSAYFVVVEGVTNIQGVPGGGGTASFQMPAPPDPPPEDPPPPQDPPPPASPPPDTTRPRAMPPERVPAGALSP